MYSFYGGRPGNSFIIVKTFPSKDVMIENFKKGPLYQDVHYDEYVLINTQNKMDETNGQIYRRGYNYNSEEGGAEYIGTIVGPQGNAPHLVLTTPRDVEGKKTEGRYSAVENSVTEGNLVPGKDGDTYNDTIKWVSVSIRNNEGTQSSAYVGLTIPYPVFKFIARPAGAYENPSTQKMEDEGKHPFYHKWQLNIPKGIKGDSVKNIRIITYKPELNILGIPENFETDKQIFVGDIINYDKADEQEKTYYLGQYDVLKDLTLKDDGTLTKLYTNSPRQELNKIKWIKSINLADNGTLTIKYNDNTTESDENLQPIKWIDSINLDEKGALTVTYNDNSTESDLQSIKWIDSINLADNGTLTVEYNNDTTDEFNQKIKWIKEVKMSKDNSALTFVWNDGNPTQFKEIKWLSQIVLDDDGLLRMKCNTDTDQTGDGAPINKATTITQGSSVQVRYHHIKWIKDINLDTTTGSLKVTWNYREDENGNSIDPIQEFPNVISQITDMRINSEENLAENQNEEDIGKLAYRINNGEYQSIGQPINYIKEVALNDNNQMLVRYSDPSKNGNIEWGNATDWTSVGDFTTNFQLSLNQLNNTFVNEHWTGIGEIIEGPDENNSLGAYIDFTIAPSYFLAQYLTCQINSIKLTVQEINPASAENDRSFKDLILNRYIASGSQYTDYLAKTGESDVILPGESASLDDRQETLVPVEDIITLNITPAGIHFRVILDKGSEADASGLTGIGYPTLTKYPKAASTTPLGNAFCYISVSQLSISFNRTDLSGSPEDEPKPFNGKYLEYVWDSRQGWQSAMTEDLLDGASQKDIAKFNARKQDTKDGYKTYSTKDDYTIPGTDNKRALAMKIYRQWHGEGKDANGNYGVIDPECLFIDLVKPEPLCRRGVHIVNIQTLWFESSIPLMVYTRGIGPSNPLQSYVSGKSDSRLASIDPAVLATEMAAIPNGRSDLGCIKYGQNQYFRIIVRNPEGSGKKVRNLHIALRFMYYIDDSNMD